MPITRWLVLTVLMGGAMPIRAEAQERSRPWQATFNGGVAFNHEEAMASVGLQLTRRLGERSPVRLGVQAALGIGESAFLTGQAIVEVVPGNGKVRPLLGAGGGVLNEDDFTGGVLHGLAGVEIGLSPESAFRVFGYFGFHDFGNSVAGPSGLGLGASLRF